MRTPATHRSHFFEVAKADDGGMMLHLWGRMDADRSSMLLRELDVFFAKAAPPSLAVELSKVAFLDDFGALVLVELKRWMMRTNGAFRLENPSLEIQQVLKTFQFNSLGREASIPKKQNPGILVRLGDSAISSLLSERLSWLFSTFAAIRDLFGLRIPSLTCRKPVWMPCPLSA
jgi:phospholipid/cholesterol/gamma-HCH transport system permease protein